MMPELRQPKTPVSFRLVIKKGENTELQVGTDDIDILLNHLQAWKRHEEENKR